MLDNLEGELERGLGDELASMYPSAQASLTPGNALRRFDVLLGGPARGAARNEIAWAPGTTDMISP